MIERKLKKELYEIEIKKNLSDEEKERIYGNLVEIVNKLNKKEKYRYHGRDDLDFHGIRDIENVFDNIDDDDITNQYQSRVLSMKTINIMNSEAIKTKTIDRTIS